MNPPRLSRLAATVLTTLSLTLPLPAGGGPRGGAARGGQDCPHGPIQGVWNLPVGHPGFASAVLHAPDGVPVLALQANVMPVPDPAGPPHGFVQGVLFALPGQGQAPQPIAAVVGSWQLSPSGSGGFQLAFLQPQAGEPPRLLGSASGAFADHPDPNVVGQLAGAWTVCP